jgi:DNA-binding ferritin-like protein
MTMAQIWPFVALMSTVYAAMIGLVLRSMAAQRAELSAKIEGTHEKVDGLRNEMHESVDGLRNEMSERVDGLRNEMSERIQRVHERVDGLRSEMSERIQRVHERVDGLRSEMHARLDPLTRTVERLDQDVRDLNKSVSEAGQTGVP